MRTILTFKLTKYLLYTMITAIGLMTLVLVNWTLQPTGVLKVHNDPVPVKPSTIEADNLVFLVVNYCKVAKASGVVRRTLVSNSVSIVLPLQTDDTTPTCQQVDDPVLIPMSATPDTYFVHFDVEYQINPLRHETDSFNSQKFKVIQ